MKHPENLVKTDGLNKLFDGKICMRWGGTPQLMKLKREC